MILSGVSAKAARVLALVFFLTTLALGGTLAWGYLFVRKLALVPIEEPALPAKMKPASSPASPLQVHYELNLPGRGEIFPALSGGRATDYWPVAVLSISNTAAKPVMQIITAQLRGWSGELRQTAIIGPHEVRTFDLNPELLANAYQNGEIRRAVLDVEVRDPGSGHTFAQQRPVFIHASSDLYWGRKFSNAQLLARWVTPHDDSVLQLVARAQKLMPGGRLRGYNRVPGRNLERDVRTQARAVFNALKQSRLSYVSSIYTFGNYPGETERIRLPRETLNLNNANCIDVSVVFASAMENLGMQPLIVVVPGHAFVGVKLGPGSQHILYLDLTVLPEGTFTAATRRAQGWLAKTPQNEVLTVDIGAARSLGIYPLPTSSEANQVTASLRNDQ